MRLIKTAIDFAEYNKNQDSILLGDWCLKNCEDILGNVDQYNKVPYHWDDREKYASDYIYLAELYEANLSKLSASLNVIHSTNYDLTYWRIVIGPWLRYFIDALFDRYECIKRAKSVGSITKSTIYPYNLDDACPADFVEFWNDFTTDEWNEVVFSECLMDLEIPCALSAGNMALQKPAKRKDSTSLVILKAQLKRLGNVCSKLFGRLQSGPVIVSAYVPLKKVIKLYFRLKMLPYFFNLNLDLPPTKKDVSLREKLSNISLSSERFECLLARLIPSFIPKSYVEDFLMLRANALNTFPKNPTSIFTANAYQADEMFKLWAAEKKSLGVPLIIGQHGGTFGMASVNQSEEHQIRIANNFVTWGWESEMSDKIISLPSFQLSGRAPINRNLNGSVLHVLSSLPRYFYQHYSMPVSGQNLLYIKNQIKFLSELEKDVLDNVRIRLDTSSPGRAWDTAKALDIAGYYSLVDRSNDRLLSLLGKSRLCVCTHNATVFLETFALDFPTIIFWEPSHHEIRPDAAPFFYMLEEAEILFYTPAEAARKVNDVSSDIDEWWCSDQVQSAKKQFCQRYARVSTDWEYEWSDFLRRG
ncbi:LIC12162 family protein [bacterium]|nr:LIC12162 family protein [bacterium]